MNSCKPNRLKGRRIRAPRGFSLIEVLITLVVIGVLAAITIPVLINALEKGRQKRTMADLRLLGGGIEAYTIDYSHYPVGTGITTLNVLLPEYMDHLIAFDGWGHDLIYTGQALTYTVGSPGKDGLNGLTLVGGGGPAQDFDDAIVFSMGHFVQWPEGTQN